MEVGFVRPAPARDVDDGGQRERFSLDVLIGLCSSPKQIPAKYFYDDRGSELFQQITGQEEYYLTRAENDILAAIRDRLPELISERTLDLVELGPGDGHKSRILIDGFLEAGCNVNYIPIDISAQAMDLIGDNIDEHPRLHVEGIVGEYFEGLRFARDRSENRQLVLFLGSNIGNFGREERQAFFRRVWNSLHAGDFLMTGFDLKKDLATLTRAYNDSRGITREFNLNLLDRINRELGGNFDRTAFQHYGVYHPVLGAMESYLVSTCEQEVRIAELGRSFRFQAWEPVHLEYSFKFLEPDIARLCEETGFRPLETFFDDQRYFADSLWRVEKRTRDMGGRG